MENSGPAKLLANCGPVLFFGKPRVLPCYSKGAQECYIDWKGKSQEITMYNWSCKKAVTIATVAS